MSSIHLDLLGTECRYRGSNPDFRSRVLEAGPSDGAPIFLLHGGGGHAETYARNLTRLGDNGIRAMAPDFIWHGMSATPAFRDGNWLRQFTEQILHLMDDQGIERATIEGESLGGWIAYDMAINFPERVQSIVLNTAWGMTLAPGVVEEEASDLDGLRTRSVEALKNPQFAALRARLEWLMYDRSKVTDELVELRHRLWTRPEITEALTRYYERVFTPATDAYLFDEEALSRISAPTLVLWTDHNPFHGVDAAKRLCEVIPNARLAIVENAGHWPQWEDPEAHDRAVMEFLSA